MARALRQTALFSVYGEALVFADRACLEAFLASAAGGEEARKNPQRTFYALDGFYVGGALGREVGYLWAPGEDGEDNEEEGGSSARLATVAKAKRGSEAATSEAFLNLVELRRRLASAEEALGDAEQEAAKAEQDVRAARLLLTCACFVRSPPLPRISCASRHTLLSDL